MGNYDLTISDIKTGIDRCLTEIYVSASRSEVPTIYYVVGGPGAGKTGVERYIKRNLKENGESATQISSDIIATFHPKYEEILENELPEAFYTLTRQFVRPASPHIYDDIRKNKISVINENTFDKGEDDIQNVKKFKNAGYRVSINIMATDIFVSRLSCFEREAAMLKSELTPRRISEKLQEKMYNSFMQEVQDLQRQGLTDDIRVYARGENINKPRLVYTLGDPRYSDFCEAIVVARSAQRREILSNPSDYLLRIGETKKTISEYGMDGDLQQNSLEGLARLEADFLKEVYKARGKE